jgi:hypothetical protein
MDVLAVTHTQEPSAAWVAQAIAKRGHRLIRLDTDLFPNAPMLRRTQRGTELRSAIQVDGVWVPLDASTSIWWRRVNLSSKIDPAMGQDAHAAAVEESRVTIRGLASAHHRPRRRSPPPHPPRRRQGPAARHRRPGGPRRAAHPRDQRP